MHYATDSLTTSCAIPLNAALDSNGHRGAWRDIRRRSACWLAACAMLIGLTTAARAQSSVVGWGVQDFDSATPPAAGYVQLAVGIEHSLAIRTDGSVVAWGDNSVGECNVPALPLGLTYIAVEAGGGMDNGEISWPGLNSAFSVALRSDGSVIAWGDNTYGQCSVPALPLGLTYVEISAGTRHALARRSDGAIAAWGDNSYGQCNVPPLPSGLYWTQVSAGGRRYIHYDFWYFPTGYFMGHSAALRSDGVIAAWGDNGYGQCNVPALPAGLTYVEVSAGNEHIVARRSDGSVVAWGSNAAGQCSVPALPAGLTYVAVDAGAGHTLALRSDGSVVAWGVNFGGQCDVPALPAGLTYVEVVAGGVSTYYSYSSYTPPDHSDYGWSLARRSDGLVVTLGGAPWRTDVPTLAPGQTFVEIDAGGSNMVARLSDGSVVAWGSNYYGQCNVPALPAGLSAVEVSAGDRHTIARLSDGSVVAWGNNYYGQCNVPALPAGVSYVEIGGGGSHSVARRSDGSVVAWGDNGYGQCNVPALPAGLSAVEVSAGDRHTIARLSDGSVVAWGNNYYGQCNVPALPAGVSYAEIGGGGSHSVARRSDGSVVAWGDNYYGQCNVPALPAGRSYVEISAGYLHIVARRSDGSVVAWGSNFNGECSVPPLPAGSSFVEIAAGAFETVARVEVASVTAYCLGDGSGAACPCGNESAPGSDAGCLNSLGLAGRLESYGLASVSGDTLVLSGSGMPNSSALYFQGTGQAGGGAGVVFGDGKRCVQGTIVRLGTKINASNGSMYPTGGDPSVSARSASQGDPLGAGLTRHYQVWYRNSAPFCTASAFNLTNGLEVSWAP